MLSNYKQILVPVDGSKAAKLAFDKSIEIAKSNQASIHLVHVIDTRAFQNISSFDNSLLDEATASAKNTLDAYLDQAHQAQLDAIDYSIEYGAPKTIIARDAPKEYHIDLIIMGATGLSAIQRLVLGSVTEYVTKFASCDTMIVRTDLNNQPTDIKNK